MKPEELITLAVSILNHMGIDIETVFSLSRKRNDVLVRNCLMALFYSKTGSTLEDIGKAFSRNHSTVIYAKNIISARHFNKQTNELYNQVVGAYELTVNDKQARTIEALRMRNSLIAEIGRIELAISVNNVGERSKLMLRKQHLIELVNAITARSKQEVLDYINKMVYELQISLRDIDVPHDFQD